MNNTIEQYTKGNINLDLPEIILSDTEIDISVEAGKTYSGTIILTNDKKCQMKGVVFSSTPHIRLKEEQFVGDENIIHFVVDVQNYEIFDTIEGNLTIISNCGEVKVPVKVTVIANSIKNGEQTIKNLFQFTDLAKEDWAKAVGLFKEEDFEDALLATEPWRYKEVYRNLLKGRSPSGALEEFLIAIHKKQPINLSVSRLSFRYEAIKEPILDKILITKDLWGYTEIRISTDAAFIELDHKMLWTDNFIGNQYSLQFQIQPSKLKAGNNFGHIYLETTYQTFEIEIVCHQRMELKQEVIDRRKMKNYEKNRLENYLEFRLQKIDFEQYVARSEELIQSAKSIKEDERLELLQTHLYIVKGDRLKAKDFLEKYEDRMSELKTSDPVLFCAVFYLKALIYQDEVMIQNANDVIRGMYQLGNQEFIIFWFLIYMDKCYIDRRKTLLEDLKKQYEMGCHSPMMYFEAMNVYLAEPGLLVELDEFAQQVLAFGTRRDFISEDVARQYAYLAGKERYFKKLTFRLLERMYEMYPQKDILTSICQVLIKGHQRANRYFKWYKLGVESQIRVTELHEYYMYAIDEHSTEPLPQPILLYFIYNSRLNDKKRAYLYARIVKEKAANASIYHTYAKKIEQFALNQLAAKNINETLAVLYEDLIEENKITEEYYPYLAAVAYRTEITCQNPNIKGVYVVHKELEGEEYVPITDHATLINVLSEEVSFYFVDQKDQRYVVSIPYEVKQLLKETDQLQQLLYIANANLYQYVDKLAAEGAYNSFDETTSSLCKKAMELPGLRSEYRNALILQLIYYYNGYHNLEALDYYLKAIHFDQLEKKVRANILDICIQRENYDQVYAELQTYGYENLSPSRLSKLCVRLLHTSTEEVAKELLIHMCLCAFQNGSREAELIEFLIGSYIGPTDQMYRIWQAASLANLKTHVMEEQLLAQVLFSQGDVKKMQEVFISYYRYAPRANIIHAYLNYVCALYLMKDIQPRNDIFECMRQEVTQRNHLYSAVALLKYYSEHPKEVIGDEKEFVGHLLDQAVAANIILPQFMNLDEKITIPNVMRNKTWIQHRSIQGKHVKLSYRILITEDDSKAEFVSELVTPSILGIYVRSFVLFYNEKLEYFFTEEVNGEEITTQVTQVGYQASAKKYSSTFEQLNEMLSLYQSENDDDGEKLSGLIERYVKKDYMIQHYFRMI